MKFVVKKEDLFEGIKIVERATLMKGLQPVLANILIESVEKDSIKLSATDFDITVITKVFAQIEEEGKITLPAKKLSDIVSRLGDGLINFELDEETNKMKIKSKNSKFDIIGISADEFPQVMSGIEMKEENSFEIELEPFKKAVDEAGFAAASYESNNLLSGVVCSIEGKTLEMASTDGNRLARIREGIENEDNMSKVLIIPSKAMNEYFKMSSFIEDEKIRIFTEKTNLVMKSENTMMITRLMEGQYPKYNQLIPTNCPKTAIVNIQQLVQSLDRVSIMVNEKTNIVKFELSENKMILKADTSETGASEEAIDIEYSGEEMAIAFNYKYVLEALRKMDSEEVKIGLNTGLSATVFEPNNEEDYICLIMPVQIR